MVEDITQRAGVAKGTFYTYFKRREDIFSVIAFERFAHIQEEFQSGPAEERLGGFLRKSMDLIVRDGSEIAQQWMKNAMLPASSETIAMNKLRFDREFIAEVLTQAIERQELTEETPVDQLAWEIAAEYYGLLALWCLTNSRMDVLNRMQEYTANTLKTIISSYKNQKGR